MILGSFSDINVGDGLNPDNPKNVKKTAFSVQIPIFDAN